MGNPERGAAAVRASFSQAVPDTLRTSRPGGGRGERGPPRQNPSFLSFIIKQQRGEGWRWESSNLLAVNKALSGDDAPACLKHPENKV